MTREVESALTAALSRRGVGGKVVLKGRVAELHGPSGGPPVGVELGDWVESWNLLPHDMKDRRIEAAAVRLQNATNTERPPAAGSGGGGKTLRTLLGYAIALGALGGVAYFLYDAGFFGQSAGGDDAATPAPAPKAKATGKDGAARPPVADEGRPQRTCEAARARIYAGAAIGVDVEGWVVELWLARQGDAFDVDALQKRAEELAVAQVAPQGASNVNVKAHEADVLGLPSAVVSLDGGFATAFFQKDGRERFIDTAAELAVGAKATHAGLYARCAHLESHDVGAWYLGKDEDAATVALLVAAGAKTDKPAFRLAGLNGGGGAVKLLTTKIDATSDEKINDALRHAGGRVNKEQGKPVTIRFPLGGPTRPAMASRQLAKLMKLE